MSIQPRLVVTGTDADGRSIVVTDAPAEATTVRAFPGAAFYLLWGTPDGIPSVGDGKPTATTLPFFAGPGGTRFLMARYAPESTTPDPEGDPAELAAEVREALPGLLDVFEPGDGPMHATDTLDYGICLEGELYLELDDGTEVLLTPGSCTVQNGTRHAWHNRSGKPAVMCFIGIGAHREC